MFLFMDSQTTQSHAAATTPPMALLYSIPCSCCFPLLHICLGTRLFQTYLFNLGMGSCNSLDPGGDQLCGKGNGLGLSLLSMMDPASLELAFKESTGHTDL